MPSMSLSQGRLDEVERSTEGDFETAGMALQPRFLVSIQCRRVLFFGSSEERGREVIGCMMRDSFSIKALEKKHAWI